MNRIKGKLHKVLMLVRQKKIVLLVSLFNVFVLSLLCYFLNNQPLFTGEDINNLVEQIDEYEYYS